MKDTIKEIEDYLIKYKIINIQYRIKIKDTIIYPGHLTYKIKKLILLLIILFKDMV